MSATGRGVIEVPISRTLALAVQPFRRDDREVHPEAVWRPWVAVGPVVESDRVRGVALSGPRRCVAVYVIARAR